MHARLDVSLAGAGIPFNGVYPAIGPDGESTAVLYEGTAKEFSTRFPDLVTTWDPDWAQNAICVDLWITLRHVDGLITAKLEGWDLVELAQRYGDRELAEACTRALSQPGDMAERVDLIGQVLELTLV